MPVGPNLLHQRDLIWQRGKLGLVIELMTAIRNGRKRHFLSCRVDDSRYVPGKRRWLKIKRFDHAYCIIIGFVPKGDGFKSLLLATNDDGELKYIGKVSTGFPMTVRRELNSLLKSRLRGNPIIECSEKAIWIEPELCCSVKHTERTPAGGLRMPVFETLILE